MSEAQLELCDDLGASLAAVEAYCSLFGSWSAEHFQDAYAGEFQHEADIDEYLVELWLECWAPIPENIVRYLDEELTARDMRYDYSAERVGNRVYLFRNC